MRKTITCALVGVMLLSLLGFYGGVVEEVEGAATYDSGTNTIFVSGSTNDLFSIWNDISDPAVFDLIAATTYVTYANIHVLQGAILTVDQGNTLRFNTSLFLAISGTLNVNGAEGNMVFFTSNRTTPSMGDWQGLIFNTTEASNSVLNYLNISYAVEGIFCDGSSPNIANSQITICSDNGLLLDNASPHILESEISGNGNAGPLDAGVYMISSSPLFENTTFINNPDRDLMIQSDSHPISLNSIYNLAIILDVNSNLTVKWYLEVYVEDDNTGFQVSGANVIVKDDFGNTIPGSPFTTDAQGLVSWIVVTELVSSTSPTEFHTPHNITVSHLEYYTGYADPEPYIGSSMQVQVNLTMIRRDLTTNLDNITFTPSGIPAAYENLQITALIHNIEVDDASNVRVIMVDEAPEGDLEIHNSTIGFIPGNSNDDAIEIWQPTPGPHTIWVYIDPYNEIAEINSNPVILAEENNNVSIPLDVNERPWVNITEPAENQEINGSITISGAAYDNISDTPSNDITRIDIRLEGYDWIELSLFIDIFPNGTPGGWNWDWDWDDTTEWAGTPIVDGNYTLQAIAWDGYHYSPLYETNIFVNNSGLNQAPVVIINEPINNSLNSVNELITFNGSLSFDPDNDPLTYSWDFDDGNFGSGNITTHSFSQKGTYNVSLTINDTQISNTTYVTVIVDNTPPTAAVTASTESAYINETITFYGYNSTDEETPEVLTYFWDFYDSVDDDGDGNFTNDIDFWSVYPVENTTFAYNESGTYTVTLTVWDGRINSTDSVTVTIDPNAAPTAFINEPITGQSFSVNETIFFNASASSDPNDPDLEYFWDFGDGTNSSWITEPTTTHSYLEYGTNLVPPLSYTISLQVRDEGGLTDTTSIFILVNNYPPVANATSNVTETSTLSDITFDGSDSDDAESPGTLTYLWDFDDGNTSSDEIAVHQFGQKGIYNVTLLVSDGLSNDTDWIIITIINRDPVIISVSYTPPSPAIGEEITFNVSAEDNDGMIFEYYWDFGDGNDYSENVTYAEDGTFDGEATHSYSFRSTFPVTVTVTDENGAQNTTQISVVIANSPPECEITYPNENDQVSDLVSIEGTSDDFDGSVSRVEVKIDNGDWQSASGKDPWSFSWDTSTYYNGQHTIYARAYDTEEYTEPPASIVVNVSNARTGIELTEFLDPTTVDAGGTVTVWGNVIYNTGEPVVNADINISILNENIYWDTSTDENGDYFYEINAPTESGPYWIKVAATKSTFSDDTQEKITVQTPTDQPDLAISGSDIILDDDEPYSGQTVKITVTVRNTGTAEANSVTVNAYYGDPATTGQAISPDGTKTITVVGAEQSQFVTMTWDTSGITGNYDVFIVLDPSNSITESDEDNNKASTLITISGRPDFTLDSDDIKFSNENPTVDDTISIFVVIHNIGSKTETVKYEVYDGNPNEGGFSIDSGEESIRDDDEKRIIITWTPDEAGDHVIFVVLTTRSSVEESDDTNNEAYNTITVEKKPGDDGTSSFLPIFIIILVIVVLLILFILYRRGQGEKPAIQELPTASVVSKEAKVVDTEKKEEEPLMDGQGGLRI